QERIGRDIAEIISEAADTPDVGVTISGCHSCMTARGIKNSNAKTYTTTYLGAFRDDAALRELLR
ncbi:MAG: GTP cyclohydrolase I, partial [Ruminococcus sp.]|nr:GTP cyclohydrolase I [Ruminococcus sp.]